MASKYCQNGLMLDPFWHRNRFPKRVCQLPTSPNDGSKTVFDAAAHGQFLGGVDQRLRKNCDSYINPDSDFNPSMFKYQMGEDGNYYVDGKKINNLHIHSKELHRFASFDKI